MAHAKSGHEDKPNERKIAGEPPMSYDRPKPSWPLWLLMALVILAGMAGFGLMLFKTLSGFGDSANRVVVPGTSQIVLSPPGSYCLYHENVSEVGGKVYRQGQHSVGFTCELTAPDGSTIPLHLPGSSMTYTYGSRAGYAIYSFEVAMAGTYTLKTSADRDAVLTVGPGQGPFFTMVLSSIGVCFGSIALAILFMVLAILRITKNRKLAAQAATAPPPTVSPPPPPQ
jgi:hypothetical protein